MTTATSSRFRLSRLWRQRLTPTPAATTIRITATPEEARQVGHDYVSDAYLPEPGQTTTALGRHHLAAVTPEPDPLLTQETRVIPRFAVAQQAARDTYDPPIYLRTLDEVRRLRALPPVNEPEDAQKPAVAETVEEDNRSGDVIAWIPTGQHAIDQAAEEGDTDA